jgi:hypothetical protein
MAVNRFQNALVTTIVPVCATSTIGIATGPPMT